MASKDGLQSIPQSGTTAPGAKVAAWRPADPKAIEDFLHLLAKAARQFHTYPPTSAACVDAIAACHKALASQEGVDQIVFRVAPRELLVGEVGVGAGTIIEHELAVRLHRAHVASVEVDRAALPRHLSRFCSDLVHVSESRRPETTLAELLVDHGVDTIVVDMAHRPEVLNLGAPPPHLCDLAARERSRSHALIGSGGPAAHLYPPDRGWIRLDPTSKFDTVSLVDLTVLVDSPVELADMLLRLTGDETAGPGSRDAALEKKFSEVTRLFSALDPRVARVMFAKLAHAVLNLEPERRKVLLQRTILPGLLDGKVDGTVLRDFPDVNLAESLCLLLDLETAVPEVLSAALDRLELPDERRQAVVPLLETHLEARESADVSKHATGTESSVDRHTRKLLKVDTADGKSFADFMAFDLSIDSQATATFAKIRDEISTSDLLATELSCLSNLVRLEPNPGQIERLLARTMELLGELERAGRWQDLAPWVTRHRQLAERLSSQRPDVAAAISSALEGFCTSVRVRRLAELYRAGDDRRPTANALIDAFGAAILPSGLALLDHPDGQALAGPLVDLMCEHAKRLAPDLVERVRSSGVVSGRAIAKVLGLAGPGYETALTQLLGRPDEQTNREALRALAQIGTLKAAALVTGQIQAGAPWMRTAAEEALWHFPPALARAKLRELIGRRDFVVANPDLAARLLGRAAQIGADNLEPALKALAPLRFRFWKPALVRVGRAARALLKQ